MHHRCARHFRYFLDERKAFITELPKAIAGGTAAGKLRLIRALIVPKLSTRATIKVGWSAGLFGRVQGANRVGFWGHYVCH